MKLVLLLLICAALSCNTGTYVYTNSLFQMQIPKDWVLKENEIDFMPLRMYKAENSILPNFNVMLLNDDKDIKKTIYENRDKNCQKGACHSNSIKRYFSNKQELFVSFQDLTIDRKRIIIRQYYIQSKNTIFLLSFFCMKKDNRKYEALFDQLVNSFVIKV